MKSVKERETKSIMRPHLHSKQARKDGIEMKTGEMNINMPVVPKGPENTGFT